MVKSVKWSCKGGNLWESDPIPEFSLYRHTREQRGEDLIYLMGYAIGSTPKSP